MAYRRKRGFRARRRGFVGRSRRRRSLRSRRRSFSTYKVARGGVRL